MFIKRESIASAAEMGCCGCFGFSSARKTKKILGPNMRFGNQITEGLLKNDELEDDDDDCSDNDNVTDTGNVVDSELQSPVKRAEEIIMYRIQNGLICREFPVKETKKLIRSEVT